MQSYPLVYIIVLSWNGCKDTLECLRSLRNNDYSNYKIIVVDNASSDGTVEAIKKEFPDVAVVENPVNLRFAGGNNVGISRAIGEGADYILLLNNDTVVNKGFLLKLVETADNSEAIGMVGPKIYYYDRKDYLWFAGGKIEWWAGWISHKGVREPDHGQYDTRCETDYITGCCILVKRSVINKIGMLDESYYIYGEDADWCVRAKKGGYKLIFEPESVIWHKLSISTGGHLSWFKNYNKFKSQIRLMTRYAKWYNWFTIPFGMLIKMLTSILNLKRV